MTHLLNRIRTAYGRSVGWVRVRLAGFSIAVLTIASVALVVLMTIFIITAVNGHQWSERTGTVGDTFGPFLSFAALGATIILAAIVQPRREAAARDKRLAEKSDDEERFRAEQVVAWMAETYAEFIHGRTAPVDPPQLGIVVSNTSGSVVFAMDFVARTTSEDAAKIARNREALIPPGTWFLALDGDPTDRRVALSWRQPVPVNTSSIPTVEFEDTGPQDHTDRFTMRTFGVRPHLPKQGVPHYRLEDLRFTLQGKSWRRDELGAISPAPKWSDAEEKELAAAESAPRASEKAERNIATLVSKTMQAISGKDNAYDAIYTQFDANGNYLNGVKRISRNRATGFYLHLTDAPDGPIVRVAGNRAGTYPERVEFFDAFDSDRKTPQPSGNADKQKTDLLTRVKEESCPRQLPTAEDWLDRDGQLVDSWRMLLQRLVDAAKAS